MSKRKLLRKSGASSSRKRSDDNDDDLAHTGTEENDYGNVADSFAQQNDDQEGSQDDDVENSWEENDDDDDSGDDSNDEVDDDDDEDEDDVAAALFQGPHLPEEEVGDGGEVLSGEEVMDNKAWVQSNNNPNTISSATETYTFDLRNVLAVGTDQLATSSLYNNNISSRKMNATSDATISIPLTHSGLAVNEEFLLRTATSGCTQLIRALWQLPTEQSDAGPLVTLPSYDEIRLPRALVRIEDTHNFWVYV
jgi:hypothetical protein